MPVYMYMSWACVMLAVFVDNVLIACCDVSVLHYIKQPFTVMGMGEVGE